MMREDPPARLEQIGQPWGGPDVRTVQDGSRRIVDDRRMNRVDHDRRTGPRIGLGLPAAIPDAPGRATVDWASRGEDLGFASLGVIDRLVYDNYDPFVALAAAAAVTNDAELFTTVLNVPWRQSALMLAKQLWSLERISDSRLVAGLALGGWPEDYRESGIDFSRRGAVFDDMLEVMLRAWKGEVSGAGGPLPALPSDRPRLLFGGFSPRSYERVARLGSGWVAPLYGFEVLLGGIASAQAAWSDAGRSGRPRIVVGRYFSLGPDADNTADEYTHHYYGDQFFSAARADVLTTSAYLHRELQRLRDAGCDDVVLFPCVADLDEPSRLADALDAPAREG
jgi:alkanesulfonate monooxygenase SsuD/methylene tetrahydromethanopterin reductase-like flavin-dependent oxidoreductase (luciferase family)